MRISDWSSDVCSSDLTCVPTAPAEGKSGLGLFFRRGGRVLFGHAMALYARGGLGGNVVVLHALLEALDALGYVTHQPGNAAAAEQQHDHQENDDPVHQRKGTHFNFLLKLSLI